MKPILCSFLIAAALLCGCDNHSNDDAAKQVAKEINEGPIVTPAADDNIGIVIVVDCSGSMAETVADADGTQRPKIDIAKRAVSTIIQQSQSFAEAKHVPVKVAIVTFSDKTTQVMPLQVPNLTTATPIINAMNPGGGTAIGDAVIESCKILTSRGFPYKHILVVTDGANTSGASPDVVAESFKQLKPELQPKVYVVAFDVDSGVFSNVIKSGWMVLPAKDGQQLQNALNTIVSGEILLEK